MDEIGYVRIGDEGEIFQYSTIPHELSVVPEPVADEPPRPEIVTPELHWWDVPSVN